MNGNRFMGASVAGVLLTIATVAWAVPMRGGCMGMGAGRMMGSGMMGSGMMGSGMTGSGMTGSGMMGGGTMGAMADIHLAHTLLANHTAIQRTVRQLPDGVETVTTSKDSRIAALLPQHVQAMYRRLQAGEVIRGFDPLFAALFQHADKIQVSVEPRKDGVRVVESSKDPYVVQLIRAHAAAVDGFVRDGMGAMHQIHPVPGRTPDPGDTRSGEQR